MILEDDNDTFVPIGETIVINGKMYVCEKSWALCHGCAFLAFENGRPTQCRAIDLVKCTRFGRRDGKDVIYKEVENATEE